MNVHGSPLLHIVGRCFASMRPLAPCCRKEWCSSRATPVCPISLSTWRRLMRLLAGVVYNQVCFIRADT